MKKTVTVIFAVLSILFTFCCCASSESVVMGWGEAANRVVKDSQPDMNWEFLMKKDVGYRCFKVETGNSNHRVKCLKADNENAEVFLFAMDYDINGYLQLMESSCVYLFAPREDELRAAFNDTIEVFVEKNNDIKNRKGTEGIEQFIEGAVRYSAYDSGDVTHVFALKDNYMDGFTRIVHYAFRSGYSDL